MVTNPFLCDGVMNFQVNDLFQEALASPLQGRRERGL